MKVAITGIIGVSKGYGGFETLAENLIGDNSPITTVYCSSKYFTKSEKARFYKNTRLIYFPINSKGYTKVLHTGLSILHAALTGHRKILLLGVSGGVILPIIRLFFPWIHFITNIDGLEWKRGKWSFLVGKFLKLSEYLCCKFSHVVIADNAALVKYVKTTYRFTPEEIAYGGDQALAGHEKSDLPSDTFNTFALCRIVPENNIHMILEAFSIVNEKIAFVGNWNDSEYGLQLKKNYMQFDNIELLDPIFDMNILYKLRSRCHVYIHGHSVGGTNPALVEMMHFGKMVYAFDCNYNRETLENNGKFFTNSKDLAFLLINHSNSYIEEGKIIKNIAERRYTWKNVRMKYFEVINKI